MAFVELQTKEGRMILLNTNFVRLIESTHINPVGGMQGGNELRITLDNNATVMLEARRYNLDSLVEILTDTEVKVMRNEEVTNVRPDKNSPVTR